MFFTNLVCVWYFWQAPIINGTLHADLTNRNTSSTEWTTLFMEHYSPWLLRTNNAHITQTIIHKRKCCNQVSSSTQNKVQMPDTRWSKYKLPTLCTARWCNFQKQRPLAQRAWQLLRKAGSELCKDRCEVAVESREEEEGGSRRAEMERRVCSHGAGGGMGGKSCFWEKPCRVVIGTAWSFLAPQCVRTGESSLCLAVQQEAKTCSLATSQSLDHQSRGNTGKGEAGHKQILGSCLSASPSRAVE